MKYERILTKDYRTFYPHQIEGIYEDCISVFTGVDEDGEDIIEAIQHSDYTVVEREVNVFYNTYKRHKEIEARIDYDNLPSVRIFIPFTGLKTALMNSLGYSILAEISEDATFIKQLKNNKETILYDLIYSFVVDIEDEEEADWIATNILNAENFDVFFNEEATKKSRELLVSGAGYLFIDTDEEFHGQMIRIVTN